MSLLGIDVGTSGCKAVVFSLNGEQLARAYREYDIISQKEGYAELDSFEVWEKVCEVIREVAQQITEDKIQALSVSSLGEALVPVCSDRKILGYSILGTDQRGEEFTRLIENRYGQKEIFMETGNLTGTFYSMAKIAWIRKYMVELYSNTDFFLTWADFICFMLGGKPATNYSLAGRTLLFDINRKRWSERLISDLKLDLQKFASPLESASFLGFVKNDMAKKLSLGKDVSIISGGHDQCCAALGCGITGNSKSAMYGMGTFICIVPAFQRIPDVDKLFVNKLHIEHHVVPNSFISFIYNQSGGALLKWYRHNFFSSGYGQNPNGPVAYDNMFDEIPERPNEILAFPGFGSTGPPDFLTGNKGVITGLSLNHTRGDVLRAMLEGTAFYIRDCIDIIGEPFSETEIYVVSGGGAVSNKWLQITANILNKPLVRNKVTEASALGAAIIAGKGINLFESFEEGTEKMIIQDNYIKPQKKEVIYYKNKYQLFKELSKKFV